MLSIANKVFRDFKEFYNEINGATLTGAIDVVVVEQPDHTYLCSPFHVRFGKLGVLRSREKIVDIEVNGEPIDIHMKLGESGEAFFVEECEEGDLNDIPNLATSPLPIINPMNEMTNYEGTIGENDEIKIPVPRRNSIDFSENITQSERNDKFENQVSDFKHRRHTVENGGHRDLTISKMELTTQKLRQELPDIHTENFYDEIKEKFNQQLMDESKQFCPIINDDDLCVKNTGSDSNTQLNQIDNKEESNLIIEETKTNQTKKKRRKKSMIKKKNAQRKSSSSSSASFSSETLETNSNDVSPSVENETASQATSNVKEEKENTPECPLKSEHVLSDIHFFSDGEIGSNNHPQQPRSLSPVQSDTEFEFSQRDKNEAKSSQVEWKWGQPVVKTEDIEDSKNNTESNNRNSMISGMLSFMKQKRKNNAVDGLFLADLDMEDPEVAALYFPPSKSKDQDKSFDCDNVKGNQDDDLESGNGTSVPHSPSNSLEINKLNLEYDSINNNNQQATDFSLNFISLSLCGGMDKEGGPTNEEFDANIIQYGDVCQNPSIFMSPNLVVRINNKFYAWNVACSYIMTLIAFQKELPSDVCAKIGETSKPQALANLKEVDDQSDTSRRSWFLWRRSGGSSSGQDRINNKIAQEATNLPSDVHLKNSVEELEYTRQSNEHERTTSFTEVYRKTLRLNSKQIESLNLKSGVNEVEFSVTTAYQGTSRCKCFLFKWNYNDKVVISDIDGTITRSDVLGHILPMVGKDWAQIGVAQLFSKIEENGYKMLYLSARAIGQSKATRDYLKSIRQGDVKLPDGPLLLNPTSLISALHREVIERKPEQFKIECLSDIKRLFGDRNPFYAGYGNRINDVWAYRAVGIPIMRIYTINPRGELKHELTQTFQSTYAKQLCIVDQLFPPIPAKFANDEDDDIEFTTFNFWREPFTDIDCVTDLPIITNNTSLNNIQSKPLATIPEN